MSFPFTFSESLWISSGVQQAYARRNEFQLADSAAYFLSNVAKFTADNFVPSDQDILRTRVKTTGIVKVRKINLNQKLELKFETLKFFCKKSTIRRICMKIFYLSAIVYYLPSICILAYLLLNNIAISGVLLHNVVGPIQFVCMQFRSH